ncbi:hypothetical protein BST27_10395 [Mycobacterium intermedium]|uniref:2,4-diaminopentanoate dehydrogenase C-terminal domain-containing protein n=1 Tax=Mycobacterium intermedium TaxID=28445 RepID=A0A1E3SLU6_MYCIE|nr:hypothetical protein [Mycobacterium intermedium]MCV6964748.1 hypothetical protein [Mycobacterium intermedium]ODR03082.1 hypothetical protein BHQ20_01420 [Mycobacterium intermedium]OPE49098.1 hypothetical protein BV508_15490 [Mycobacterium intermedium]ORB06815.1 hypothetical protein BST27_10395 [Mycobacterium intermedium]
MADTYRVAHVGTGYTGAIALRHVLRSPSLKLVGHLVNTPGKAGRDSGELVGCPATGVVATESLDELLALDADCVTYFAAVSGREPGEIVDQLCAIAASGKNVVTPSYHPLFHPPSLDEMSREKLSAACEHGQSSIFATGIAPGFATDLLGVHAASMSGFPTKITVAERIPCGSYSVPGFFAMLGFGRTPEEDAATYPRGSMATVFATPLRLLAEGIGQRIDEVEEHRDIATATRDYQFDAGVIRAGTIASVRMTFTGIVNGRPRLQFSSIWSMPDDPVEDWPPTIPEGSSVRRLTRISIDGDPRVEVDFALYGDKLPGSAATAARVVNAIPAVCAARPGVLSGLELVVTGQSATG